MKKWVGWVLLVLSLYITYEGWRNSQVTDVVQSLARAAACEGEDGCEVEGDEPQSIRTSFFGQTYTWKTSAGTSRVECGRAFVFQGRWVCAAKKG